MIDLASLGSLFSTVLKDSREPNVVRISLLPEIDHEPEYQRLKSEGRPMRWVGQAMLHRYSRQGWRPVTRCDRTGSPTVFMDRHGRLVLLYQAENEDQTG